MDIPPANTQCRATIGTPAKCHSNVLDVAKRKRKKGRRGRVCVWGGDGVGNRLEDPVETHSIFAVFFLHVLLLLFLYGRGGGVNC